MDYFKQESERLIFRKLTKEDIPGWVEFFVENDHLKYLGIDLHKSKNTLADNWVNKQINRYENNGLGHLAIELKTSGVFVGMGGILAKEVDGKEEYEIAYSLIPRYWGNGYATEIARTMLAYGTQNIDTDRFISIIHVDNMASVNVAHKNNMQVLFQTKHLGMPVNVYGTYIVDDKNK